MSVLPIDLYNNLMSQYPLDAFYAQLIRTDIEIPCTQGK